MELSEGSSTVGTDGLGECGPGASWEGHSGHSQEWESKPSTCQVSSDLPLFPTCSEIDLPKFN